MAALSTSDRAVLLAIFDAIVPASEIRERAFANFLGVFSEFSEDKAGEIKQFLALLQSPFFAFALIGKFKPFAGLAESDKERLLCALSDSAIPQFRTIFQLFKRLSLFISYATVDAKGANPLWHDIGYPGPRQDAKGQNFEPEVVYTLAERSRFDAVVIGSGAGGGVAAALLANAGLKVCVLEAGGTFSEIAARQLEGEATSSLYLDKGLTATKDLSVALFAGSCIGGGTTVNWSTSLRLEDYVAEQWDAASGGIDFKDSLKSHYAAVSRRMEVKIAPEHNLNNLTLEHGCQALGWDVGDLPRNASGCGQGCGYCGFGCAYGHKRGTASTYLIDAVKDGAVIVAKAVAERVLIKSKQVTGVVATLQDSGAPRTVRIDAPLVVLAAGALRTPRILASSGISHRHLGCNLRLHPVTPLIVQFDRAIDSWAGPIQTIYSGQFKNLHDGYGAVLEVAGGQPGLMTHARPWRSKRQHYEEMHRLKNSGCYIVLTRDRGSGSVSLTGRNDIVYNLSSYDAAHQSTALAGAIEIAFAAGATRILTAHADPLSLTRTEATRERLQELASTIRERGARPNSIALFSAHQMGTARMNVDPRNGVVDQFGRVHGVNGLVVSDSSVFPLASGVNPMLTIMALAHRSVSQVAKEYIRDGSFRMYSAVSPR
jgi:choline dehydrogenase-like flavoprotein